MFDCYHPRLLLWGIIDSLGILFAEFTYFDLPFFPFGFHLLLIFFFKDMIHPTTCCCSQSSLTGESGIVEKMTDIIEEPNTPLLELRNICFMVIFQEKKNVDSVICLLFKSLVSLWTLKPNSHVSFSIWQGTSVVSGSGTGVVVSTGEKTYISTILSALGRQSPPDAFEKGVKRVSYMLICFMLVIVPIIVTVDYLTTHDWGSLKTGL